MQRLARPLLVAVLALAALAAALLLALREHGGDVAAESADQPKSASGAARSVYPILIPGGEEAVSGHVRWTVIGARLDPRQTDSEGADQLLELRVTVRATELSSQDTRITNQNVRLMAGGRQLSPEKPFSEFLYASQSLDLRDLLFVVPASSTMATLQLGTSDSVPVMLVLRF